MLLRLVPPPDRSDADATILSWDDHDAAVNLQGLGWAANSLFDNWCKLDTAPFYYLPAARQETDHLMVHNTSSGTIRVAGLTALHGCDYRRPDTTPYVDIWVR